MMKNKFIRLAAAAAALVFLGAGCVNVERALVPLEVQPDLGPINKQRVKHSLTVPDKAATGVLHVAWAPPTPTGIIDLFTDSYKAANPYSSGSTTAQLEYVKDENYRQIGVVKDGTYAGDRLAIMSMKVRCSVSGSNAIYRLVLPATGRPVMLAKLSSEYSGDRDFTCQDLDARKFVLDTTADAPELKLPEKLTHAGSTYKLVQSNASDSVDLQVATPLFDATGREVAFTDPTIGKVYRDAADAQNPQFGFYAVAPDGTMRSYALVVPFYDETLHVPSVTWSDGTKNDKQFWLTKADCRTPNFANVIQGVEKADLTIAGLTAQRQSVYLLKDPNHEILKKIYDDLEHSEASQNGQNRPAYDEFVKMRPIFFWYDPLGRLIGFLNADFIPAADCGK